VVLSVRGGARVRGGSAPCATWRLAVCTRRGAVVQSCQGPIHVSSRQAESLGARLCGLLPTHLSQAAASLPDPRHEDLPARERT
jgi:hypothetical protein